MNKNGIFSSRDDTDYSQSTLRRLSSDKILLLVCAGIAAFCDLITFIVSLVAGYGAGQVVLTVFMLIADGLFIAGICLTNFRFKYSLAVWIGYVAVSFVLSLIMLVGCSGGSGVYTMTTAATALVILSHLILWIVIGVCALADNFFPRKSYVKIVICVVTGLAVLLTFAYSIYVADKGYYGQNEDNNIRVVAYTEDFELDGYKASSVVEGRGDKIVIPSTFNGKKVVSISANILKDKSINNIVIEGSEMLEIKGIMDDTEISQSLRIGVSQHVIDAYRAKHAADTSDYSLTLVNAFYPADLEEDQTYITFAYDWMESNLVRGQLIPTWIGKKGEVFNLESYAQANSIAYVNNRNMTDDLELDWNVSNNLGYIFKSVTFDGESVEDITVDESIYRAKVSFDKIYKVEILDDNDTLYEPDEDFKTMNLYGNTYEYRYVAESLANSFLQEISREGFNLTWKYDYNGATYYADDLSKALAEGKVSFTNGRVQLTPEWQLKSPVINGVTTDKANNSFVYGDDMTLSVDATAPAQGFNLSYEWKGVTSNLGTSKDILLNCVTPDHTGRYTVTVTASSPQTSLTSEATAYTDVDVAKKVLRFEWTFPQDAVYDGTSRQAVCEIVAADVVADDVLNIATDATAVKDAGNYSSKVTLLSGDNASYYEMDASCKFSYSVAKRSLTLVWEDKEFTYNGNSQYPSVASLTNAVAGEDDEILSGITYSNYGKNAGSYNVRASLPADSNYSVTQGASKSYSINKKEVSLVWQSVGTYVYNGYAQYPVATDITGTLDSDKTAVFANIVYSDYGIGAGEYTVKAKLGAGSSNYLLTGEMQKTYSIDKKALTINAVAQNKTYDGKAGGSFSVTVTGLVGNDTVASLGTPVFAGDAVNAVDAGSYTLSVSFAQNSVNKNYSISYNDGTFVISPKTVSAVWSSQREFVFDGNGHSPYIVTQGTEYENQAVISYEYYTSDGQKVGSPIEEGEYYVQAKVQSKNFVFTGTSVDFRITAQEEA